MAEIIRLYGDAHRQTQRLLPWYVNGTLDPGDRATVETHLPDCAECRTDLRLERALGRKIATMPLDDADAWAALRDRVATPQRRRATPWRAARDLFHHRVPVGWALAAQAASLVVAFGLIGATAWLFWPASYVTLGARSNPTAGNVVVMFTPTTSEADLRGALMRGGARLADGPTASGAYVLSVPPAKRDAAMSLLKADRHVTLVEPIDGPGRP